MALHLANFKSYNVVKLIVLRIVDHANGYSTDHVLQKQWDNNEKENGAWQSKQI
jgi:hypothetical protein